MWRFELSDRKAVGESSPTAVVDSFGGRRPRLWIVLLKVAVSVGLVAIVLSNIDLRAARDKLELLSVVPIVLVVFILTAQALLAACRWRAILRYQGIPFTFAETCRIFLIGAFFNQVLPSSFGGDVVRGWCVYRAGYGKGVAAISILTDRMYGMAALVLLALLTLPGVAQVVDDRLSVLAVGVAVLGASFALVGFMWLDKLPRALQRWKIFRGLSAWSGTLRGVVSRPGTATAVMGLSLSVHLLTVVAIASMIAVLEPGAHLGASALVLPIIALLSMVPLSVAGWGVREGVMVYGLGLVGVAPESALVASVVFGLVLTAIGVFGGAVWLGTLRRGATPNALQSRTVE